MNNSKHNVRKDKKLQIWANLKRNDTDATLFWAARKLKSWGAFEKVDDCFVSGTVSVLILREIKFSSVQGVQFLKRKLHVVSRYSADEIL